MEKQKKFGNFFKVSFFSKKTGFFGKKL